MTRRVRLSRRARADLRSIFRYTTETWGDAQADRYLADPNDTIEKLAMGRRLGRSASVIGPGISLLRMSSHVIYFRMTPDTLFIVRILHERMDTRSKRF